MYALEIVGKDMNLQTRYEKEGVYITDVEIEGSRVHLQRMTRVGDSYMTAGADTLVCNEEVEEDSMEGIGYLPLRSRDAYISCRRQSPFPAALI